MLEFYFGFKVFGCFRFDVVKVQGVWFGLEGASSAT